MNCCNMDELKELLILLPADPMSHGPKGAERSVIENAESRLGISFPQQLRDWLGVCNGALLGPGGLYGVGCEIDEIDIIVLFQQNDFWKQNYLLPIAGDGCGNDYAILTCVDSSPVVFIEHSAVNRERPQYVVGSDVFHFLRNLFRRELGISRWPFNRTEVLLSDPKIQSFKGIPLPWDA